MSTTLKTSAIILLLTFSFFACKKEKIEALKNGISYPLGSVFDLNLLMYDEDTAYVSGDLINLGLKADLEENASLQIKLFNLSEDTTGTENWFISSVNGWSVGTYHNESRIQIINAAKGVNSLNITFSGSNGLMKMEVYPNGASLSKTQYVRFQ